MSGLLFLMLGQKRANERAITEEEEEEEGGGGLS